MLIFKKWVYNCLEVNIFGIQSLVCHQSPYLIAIFKCVKAFVLFWANQSLLNIQKLIAFSFGPTFSCFSCKVKRLIWNILLLMLLFIIITFLQFNMTSLPIWIIIGTFWILWILPIIFGIKPSDTWTGAHWIMLHFRWLFA